MGKIDFERFELDNGLKVIVHQDTSTPLACLNVMYDVGSRDEDPDRTGFAHLFEHLMFGGSANIPVYDTPLQIAGGSNNAFTSTDITNYYITLPTQNLETAFWLESDRMLNLAFTPKSLEVQRNVVIEEFRQRYLNQPYGDAWLLMRPMAHKEHPYQWATIGKNEKHIEEATMLDVKSFYQKFYRPKNAILVVAGNVTVAEVKELSEKWFAPIEKGEKPERKLPTEPEQKEARRTEVERPVPLNAVYISFHMCGKADDDYQTWDLISDMLSGGQSSRLQQRLVKEQRVFTSMNAFVMGERDPSLFTVAGHISQGVSIEDAEKAIWNEIELLKQELVEKKELEKVKNQVEANHEFSEMSLLNRAIGLAYNELLGDANLINTEIGKYKAVSDRDIQRVAKKFLTKKQFVNPHLQSDKLMLVRSQQPAFGKLENIGLQEPTVRHLSNGLPVFSLDTGTQEILKIELVFGAGTSTPNKILVGSAAANLMKEGTGKKSAAEIAEAVDFYGAYLQGEVTHDECSLSLYSLNKHLKKTLPILAEVQDEASYPEREFETYILNHQQEMLVNQEKVGYLGAKAFTGALFGTTHPYGRSAEVDDYAKLSRADLVDFHNTYVQNKIKYILVAGKLAPDTIELLDKHFGNQLRDELVQTSINIAEVECDAVHVTKEEAVQNAIRVGRLLFNRTHPDFIGMQILATVLGGYFGSRLMSNIREDKGYTYGINAGLVSLKHSGYFTIATQVGSDVCQPALNEIYSEIERLRKELIPNAELELVRNYMLGSILKSLDGPFNLATKWRTYLKYDLGVDSHEELVHRIKTITSERLRELAQQYLQRADLKQVTAGQPLR